MIIHRFPGYDWVGYSDAQSMYENVPAEEWELCWCCLKDRSVPKERLKLKTATALAILDANATQEQWGDQITITSVSVGSWFGVRWIDVAESVPTPYKVAISWPTVVG